MLQSVSKIAAFTRCEVMRILVSRQPLAPGRASRGRHSVHVSHSSFVGLELRFTIRLTTSSRNARVAGLLNSLESQVTPEPLSPVYSSSVPARPGCVRCRPAPGRRQHQTLEGPVDIVGRRANPPASAPAPRSNWGGARCAVGAPLTAISSLGVFRTPAVGARGWRRHAGVRKTFTKSRPFPSVRRRGVVLGSGNGRSLCTDLNSSVLLRARTRLSPSASTGRPGDLRAGACACDLRAAGGDPPGAIPRKRPRGLPLS
jgi:hypothetical protein